MYKYIKKNNRYSYISDNTNIIITSLLTNNDINKINNER